MAPGQPWSISLAVIAPRYNWGKERDADLIEEFNQIIIAGHGRVGGLVSRMLRGAGYTPTVIDYSSKQLELLSKFGVRAYYGDATRPDLLHSAGIDEAKLFIIAIDEKAQITDLVKYVVHTHPNVHIIARAVDRDHVCDLYAAGCRDIIRENYDSSLRIGRSAYEALGANKDQAEKMKNAYDTMDRKSVITLAQHYDPDIPGLENVAYVAKVREMAAQWEKELNIEMAAILEKA